MQTRQNKTTVSRFLGSHDLVVLKLSIFPCIYICKRRGFKAEHRRFYSSSALMISSSSNYSVFPYIYSNRKGLRADPATIPFFLAARRSSELSNTSPLSPPLPLSSLGSASTPLSSSSASHSQHLRFICGIVYLQPAPCVLITAPFAATPTWEGPQTCLFNSTSSSHHQHIHYDNHTHRHQHNHFPEIRRSPSRSRSSRPDVFLLGLSNSGTMGSCVS